jgi:hypothetical protein
MSSSSCFGFHNQPPSSIDVITYELNDDTIGYGKESFFAYGLGSSTTSGTTHPSNVTLETLNEPALSSLVSSAPTLNASQHHHQQQQQLIASNAASAQVVAAPVTCVQSNVSTALQLQAAVGMSSPSPATSTTTSRTNNMAASLQSSANAFNAMLQLHKSSALDSFNAEYLRLSNDMMFNALDAAALPPFFGNLMTGSIGHTTTTLSTSNGASDPMTTANGASLSTPQSIALHVLSNKSASPNLDSIASTQFLRCD